LKNNDELFRELARRYVQAEGEVLERELAEHPEPVLTPVMDQRVRKTVRPRHAGKMITGLGVAAAALILIFLTPTLLRRVGVKSSDGNSSFSTPNLVLDVSVLPSRLSVAGTMEDHGQSIYRLADSQNDDVVLTLEENRPIIIDNGLMEVAVNGKTAYIKTNADVKLLTFEKNGLTYTLTCRYELDTLLELGKNIL